MTCVCNLQVEINEKCVRFIFRIDDIEDNSTLRRGVPVAHSIYGVASTINAANYIFFLALEKVQSLDHPDVSSARIKLVYDRSKIFTIDICFFLSSGYQSVQ